MNADDYVNKVVAANLELFAAQKIQIAPDSLKKQLRAAFQSGFSEGRDCAKRVNESGKSLFEQAFGKTF